MPTQNPWVWAPNVVLYIEAPNVTLFCRKVGGDADVIHRICCPSSLFIHISCYYHTYNTNFGK